MTDKILRKYNYPEEEISRLIQDYKSGVLKPESNIINSPIESPAEEAYFRLPDLGSSEYKRFFDLGLETINSGRLGMVILNGGMATRFGGVVKGTVEVYDSKSFLELKISTACRNFRSMKVYVMNSFATDEKTKEHFEEKNHFGFKENIKTFTQFIAPRLSENGDLYRNEDGSFSYYGPGHGDFPSAFMKSGLLEEFINAGGEYIFFSNVDNLGARVDPVLLGIHVESSKPLSAEVARKDPGDEGGAPAVVGGRLQLVEGFCFPKTFDQSWLPVFNCATYWVNAAALRREFDLPWYLVTKKVNEEKVIQFEHLAGDLTMFLDTNFIEVERKDRFIPIKKPDDLVSARDSLKNLLEP